ncbi:hypothetical protein [Methylobacterium planeticum]|uniref:Uncharacterized protein n=1 Tax=Methylobacterium planeticum TaxID=2615211 RepID=A0A6N6MJI9_9HYPH|nr:hypothetical protein [Methylobacterium planeticum]KAB1070160.1 hypothetical protein F6X51_23620 [Methylobacterium planeticum]
MSGQADLGSSTRRPEASLVAELERNLSRVERAAAAVSIAILLLVVGYSIGVTPAGASVLVPAMIIGAVALASALLGGLAGFLFGIPRLLARDAPAGNPSDPQPSGEAVANRAGRADGARLTKPLQANSNLEEISDWITKILVGLGLVNAGKVTDAVREGASHVASQGLASGAGADMVVLSIGLASFLLGFLFFYLQTRTRITLMLFATEGMQEKSALPLLLVEAANKAWITSGDGATVATAMSARIGWVKSAVEPVPADREILRVGFDDLRRPEEFAAWGAAQARAGNLEAAETSLRRANALAPSDPRILRRIAEIRALRGDRRGAVETLGEAREKAPNNWRIKRQELLLALYLPVPEGFRRAEPLADALAGHSEAGKDPMVHVWRACAYGQKHRWLREGAADEASLRQAREAALASVERAVELSPEPTSTPRKLLRRLLDPKAEQGDPTENDLEDFKDDDAFRAIVRGR